MARDAARRRRLPLRPTPDKRQRRPGPAGVGHRGTRPRERRSRVALRRVVPGLPLHRRRRDPLRDGDVHRREERTRRVERERREQTVDGGGGRRCELRRLGPQKRSYLPFLREPVPNGRDKPSRRTQRRGRERRVGDETHARRRGVGAVHQRAGRRRRHRLRHHRARRGLGGRRGRPLDGLRARRRHRRHAVDARHLDGIPRRPERRRRHRLPRRERHPQGYR